MFQENLKILRKNKGLTQEELAARVHVVRQTVSKWEKGLSVPDAYTLQKLAEVLETEVSRLLGANIAAEEDKDEIAEQLARLNEQLVIKNRRAHRIWKIVGISLLVIVACYVILVFLYWAPTDRYKEESFSSIEEIDFENIVSTQ